jgi:2'-5' RNA ligase
MPHAICLKADNDTARNIRALWDAAARFETEASMAALGYAPHITLAIYHRIELALLTDAFEGVFRSIGAIRLTFEGVRAFDDASPVLWAAPRADAALNRAHEAIHRAIDPARCRKHYRPGRWIPHCTLATNIPPARLGEALDFANASKPAFEVVFDVADCLSFYPVEVVAERRLRPSGDIA